MATERVGSGAAGPCAVDLTGTPYWLPQNIPKYIYIYRDENQASNPKC